MRDYTGWLWPRRFVEGVYILSIRWFWVDSRCSCALISSRERKYWNPGRFSCAVLVVSSTAELRELI